MCGYEEICCNNCGVSGTLDGGSLHGQLYECEDDCGKFICVQCLLANKEYQTLLKESQDGIATLNKVVCISCLEKGVLNQKDY